MWNKLHIRLQKITKVGQSPWEKPTIHWPRFEPGTFRMLIHSMALNGLKWITFASHCSLVIRVLLIITSYSVSGFTLVFIFDIFIIASDWSRNSFFSHISNLKTNLWLQLTVSKSCSPLSNMFFTSPLASRWKYFNFLCLV